MDKQGALYLKLISGLLAVVFALYGAHRLWKPPATYTLQSAQISEVGDGITVSGFLVRYEHLIYASEPVSLLPPEGQWVSGNQLLAQVEDGEVRSPHSGYLSHSTDGYEEVLTPDFLMTATLSELYTLEPRRTSSTAVGRIIGRQQWYFAAAPCEGLEIGQSLRLCIGTVECPAKVLRSHELLLLECTGGLPELSHLRTGEARLCLSSQRGLSVPREAIYYEKGTSCVYLLESGRARRKAVEILDLTEDRVFLTESSLPQGAQVILSNIELTDGMILK
ncbi:MAG: hypothetical protein IKT58_03475 [Oscillospiraceae bacterium]|nr:hypothetical protein [Oscillospiraceae bacterium]